jgi:uncharacterized membrane protein
MPSLIAQYLAEFDRALGFDRGLARRVHAEIEAHLLEAMDDAQNEKDAIARFGNPNSLARDYAEAALPKRLRRAGATAATLAVATFVFMRLRTMLLALPGVEAEPATVLTFIDRAGFATGLFFSLYAWHAARSVSGTERARRIFGPLLGAAAAFLLSIVASLLRALPASGGESLVWITGSLEILLIGGVAVQLHQLRRHATAASKEVWS